jgi:hypothetical protein
MEPAQETARTNSFRFWNGTADPPPVNAPRSVITCEVPGVSQSGTHCDAVEVAVPLVVLLSV